MPFFATSARGVAPLLAAELRALGAAVVRETPGGVAFDGPLELAYRACLWLRTAQRVLLPLGQAAATEPAALYEAARTLPWEDHLRPNGSLVVDVAVAGGVTGHSHFAALRVKDAIVDRFRERTGQRPTVDRERPDVRVHLRLGRDGATLSLDLSGGSLHRRGWRGPAGPAPLRETLAAAILLHADWPHVAAAGGGLVDPMCGAATFLVEGAFMAADVAPGLALLPFGLAGWRGHEPARLAALVAEARDRDRRGRAELPALVGYDADPRAVAAANENVARAGLRGAITLRCLELGAARPPAGPPGLVVTNPPYGERLGEPVALRLLYHRLGDTLKQHFAGWTAHVLTPGTELARYVGLRADRRTELWNGPIECRLLRLPLHAGALPQRPAAAAPPPAAPSAPAGAPPETAAPAPRPATSPVRGAAPDLQNRLRKNLARLRRWADRAGVSCYRLYDCDLPEYAVAVDRYGPAVLVQERAAPPTVDPVRAVGRLDDALRAVAAVLEVEQSEIVLKRRTRQRGSAQYGRLDATRAFRTVAEGGHQFLVNLHDYLDTGLFLDGRGVRQLVAELAAGARFLNLFGYTGAATVYAAKAGARSTCTVDLSQTYLTWAERNFRLNGIGGAAHRLERADALRWIERDRDRYDLILLDPPTFSNSKAMATTFAVQRDHVALVQATARLLSPGGVLLFMTNHHGFRLDPAAVRGLHAVACAHRTLQLDFARHPQRHHVWRVERPRGAP